MSLEFWKNKSLSELTDEEWESLCDGCGQCCLNKLIDSDTDEIYFTNVACNLLDSKSCQCQCYHDRFKYEPDCIKLTIENVYEIPWLPETCAYRLLRDNLPLPEWHPLISGSKSTMHKNGYSVRGKIVYEKDVKDWEDHIINK